MKFSIIVPVYNAAKTINRCADSILAQTFQDYEIIFINDGSTDKTQEMLNQLEKYDSRIKVVRQRNQGVSSARNHGIALSSGDYILFIDSDDWIDPHYLESFSRTNDCISKLKIGTIAVTNLENKLNYDIFTSINGKFLDIQKAFSEAGLLHNGFPFAKAYNRQIIIENNIKFKEDIAFKEDLIFFLDYSKFCKTIEFVDNARYYYIIHSNSLSTKTHTPATLLKTTKIIIKKSEIFNTVTQFYSYMDSYLRLCTEEIIYAVYCNNLTWKERKANLKELINLISSERHYPRNYKTDKILKLFFNEKSLYIYDMLKRIEHKFLR